MGSQFLDRCVEGDSDPKAHDLLALAPFLSRGKLSALAEGMEGEISFQQLAGLAPFLTREALGAMGETIRPTSYEELQRVAPFLDRVAVSRMAKALTGGS